MSEEREVVWSKYQRDIFDNALDPEQGSFCIEASAGSGKTTVLVEMAKRLARANPDVKILFIAFNKSIAEKLAQILADYSNMVCKTAHGFGLSVLYKSGFNFIVDENKWEKYVETNFEKLCKEPELDKKRKRAYIDNCVKLFNLCRAALVKKDDTAITEMADIAGIALVSNEIEAVKKLMVDANMLRKFKITEDGESKIILDFSDMVSLAVSDAFRGRIPKYKFVMCDEAQDMTYAQQQLVMNAVQRNGKLIAVGDTKQSIYFFATGSANTFDKFKELCGNRVLPLSVCYRCGKNIIAEAQKINPLIEAYEGAGEGEVIHQNDLSGVQPGDMVLCRKTSPLVAVALKMMALEIPCFIKGKDLAENLKNTIGRIIEIVGEDILLNSEWMGYGIELYLTEVSAYLQKRGIEHPEHTEVYEQAVENTECIKLIGAECNTVKDIADMIDRMFSDIIVGNAVMLSTVHKAKGLEAENVYIIRPDILPYNRPGQTSIIQSEQEINLKYVAVTRAMKKLVFCDGREKLLCEGLENYQR